MSKDLKSDEAPPSQFIPGEARVPALMGILNVTPDSFYDGGQYDRVENAVNRARAMAEAGADVIDIGGESTRPGASPVPADEEIQRVVPVIEQLRREGLETPISIDTKKSTVALRALNAGADWINDISALRNDPEMVDVVADRDVPVVLMHMQGTPETMQDNPRYDDVVRDVCEFFRERIDDARDRGIERSNIILDPGIGFGKTQQHNHQLLTSVDKLKSIGCPVLVGHSRKSFLEPILGSGPDERLAGTLTVSAFLGMNGVDLLRVHDLREHRDLRATLRWLDSGNDSEDG